MRNFLIVVLLICSFCVQAFSVNELEQARMEVDFDESLKNTMVRITCQIHLDSDVDRIPLRVVADERIALLNPKALIGGDTFEIDLKQINQRVARGNILGLRLSKSDSLLTLSIHYDLEGLVWNKKSVVTLIPVLFVDWKAEQASVDAFSAHLRLPKQYSLRSIFPAMIWKKKADEDTDVYSFSLQTLPAWISCKIYIGPQPFFSLERLVDLGVILILLALMIIGWKKLKNG